MQKSGTTPVFHSAEVAPADLSPVSRAGLFASNGHSNGHTADALDKPSHRQLLGVVSLSRREEMHVWLVRRRDRAPIVEIQRLRLRRDGSCAKAHVMGYSVSVLAELEACFAQARALAADDLTRLPAAGSGCLLLRGNTR